MRHIGFGLVAGEGRAAQNRVSPKIAPSSTVRAAGIHGGSQGVINPVVTLSWNVKSYPAAVARTVGQMRLAGVNGPYALLLGAEQYTAASGVGDERYPILQHIQHLVDGESSGPQRSKGVLWLRRVAVILS